ncbi:hypothetical protein EVG20_g11400, partial [Dentipellis fragilis]
STNGNGAQDYGNGYTAVHHPNPHVRRKLNAAAAAAAGGTSFASLSNMRRCVIDVSDTEDEDGEEDGAQREASKAGPSRPSGIGSGGTPRPGSAMGEKSAVELELEIKKMREMIREREEMRLRKLAAQSNRSTRSSTPTAAAPQAAAIPLPQAASIGVPGATMQEAPESGASNRDTSEGAAVENSMDADPAPANVSLIITARQVNRRHMLVALQLQRRTRTTSTNCRRSHLLVIFFPTIYDAPCFADLFVLLVFHAAVFLPSPYATITRLANWGCVLILFLAAEEAPAEAAPGTPHQVTGEQGESSAFSVSCRAVSPPKHGKNKWQGSLSPPLRPSQTIPSDCCFLLFFPAFRVIALSPALIAVPSATPPPSFDPLHLVRPSLSSTSSIPAVGGDSASVDVPASTQRDTVLNSQERQESDSALEEQQAPRFRPYDSLFSSYPLLGHLPTPQRPQPSTVIQSTLAADASTPDLRPLKARAFRKHMAALGLQNERICQYEVPGGGECRDAQCRDLHLSRVVVDPSGAPHLFLFLAIRFVVLSLVFHTRVVVLPFFVADEETAMYLGETHPTAGNVPTMLKALQEAQARAPQATFEQHVEEAWASLVGRSTR